MLLSQTATEDATNASDTTIRVPLDKHNVKFSVKYTSQVKSNFSIADTV